MNCITSYSFSLDLHQAYISVYRKISEVGAVAGAKIISGKGLILPGTTLEENVARLALAGFKKELSSPKADRRFFIGPAQVCVMVRAGSIKVYGQYGVHSGPVAAKALGVAAVTSTFANCRRSYSVPKKVGARAELTDRLTAMGFKYDSVNRCWEKGSIEFTIFEGATRISLDCGMM